jgi:hypothetical protein
MSSFTAEIVAGAVATCVFSVAGIVSKLTVFLWKKWKQKLSNCGGRLIRC